VDSPPGENVLLGSMAQSLNADRQSSEDGRIQSHAVLTGRNSRGPWHLARTEATQLAMSNGRLAQKGLVSVKDLWVSFNYPR
jgi:hypothetical protein